MNKTERLILLLRDLSGQDELTLKYISDRYAVSERTVYRDLNTLTNLGFEIDLDKGRLLERKIPARGFTEFNETEIRLVVFALRTNSLGKIFPFEELADKIEKRFRTKLD